MKKLSILGATTLAGTILFTGIGHQAQAAEQLNMNNAKDIAIKASSNDQAKKASFSPEGNSDIANPAYTTTKSGNDYIFSSPEGAYTYRLTNDGKLYITTKYDGKEHFISQENVEESSQQATQKQAPNNNQVTNETPQHINQSQQQVQSQATVLPTTGKDEVNSSLVTSIATVLLAVGSLLTFKRFSNNK
ncbi:LPXTG cell wall anchor domain-containing protein [Staphylococcus simiae]|uniref:Cell wall surface anchor family protein n=1 Tax=Staphylococcus simiae CCM 7213 = CCUG 51256 TaxID=911238 RepID=G5JKL4_9STAP|nr:LPXTG cell wall anchor domain-containing protein [Staphylococcus simiae]EHJ07280.1 cell wall surface anchor family protein [Staphylococcus simiae CCM 7213 = CCUG 51256]PNZ13332.1 cell wall anchor protein [Staphylococcus simiae]SNV80760.1 LPXTG-motif surface-anchored protein [Staphylococcus simiae]